jgi:hypothetical protein
VIVAVMGGLGLSGGWDIVRQAHRGLRVGARQVTFA